jgi:hypothetical protein
VPYKQNDVFEFEHQDAAVCVVVNKMQRTKRRVLKLKMKMKMKMRTMLKRRKTWLRQFGDSQSPMFDVDPVLQYTLLFLSAEYPKHVCHCHDCH